MSQLESEQTNNNNDRQQKKNKKKYEPADYYVQNAFIDCKDSVNSWCLARILERDDRDSTLRINFDGWSHKWDEWVKISSSKIAPFRRFSTGYTGQNKFAIRDWKFSLQELKQKTTKLKEITDSKFESLKTPNEITQYLRGEEFVYVDCLLQNEYQNPNNELPFVFEHFRQYIRLYITFLNLLPDLIPDYIEGLSNPDAFLTNERVALAHSLYELSDAFNKILGSSERLWSHFGNYDSSLYNINICDKTTYAGKDIELIWTADKEEEDEAEENLRGGRKPSRKYSRLICQLVNLFGEMGGFEAWLKAFTYYKEESKDNIILPPFRMLQILMINISNINVFLNKDFSSKLMPSIKEQLVRRLKYISDKEIKDIDKDALSKFMLRVQTLLIHHYPKEEVFLLTETAELELALRFLTCPYFEKRLRGINEIKELTEKIDSFEQANRDPSGGMKNMGKMTRYLNAKMFIDWVFKNKIFELILGDSMHVEIIKRTHEILKFVGKYQSIPLELIDLLWNSCEGKHEATLMGMYDLIVEISDHLDDEGIKRLKEKIESIPEEEHNEMTLNLIKGFAQKTLPPASSEKTPVDESQFHCLGTLWKLMLDESKVSTHLSELALNSLAVILSRERACRPLRKIYLVRCFEKIKQRSSVAQCINLIHSILNNGYSAVRYDSESSLGHVLKELDMEFDLNNLMINEFADFYRKMSELVRKTKPEPPESDKDNVYIGKYSYRINFQNRLIFLEFLITNEYYDLSLTVEQAARLWDILVLDPIWESDKDAFFAWISRKQEAQKYSEPNLLFPKEVLPEFFEKVVCNHKKLDFFNLNPEGFDCFATFFRLVNEANGKFRILRPKKIQIVNLDYDGKETLWSLFLNCRNDATIPLIVNLLVECNLKLGPNLESKKKEVWEKFVTKCVDLLKDGSKKQNDRLISKAVMVLMNFFDRFEGKNKYERREESGRIHSTVASIILRPDNINKNIIIGVNQPIGFLRKKIAEAFSIDINEFKLFARGNSVDPDEDDTPYLQYGFTGPWVIHRVQPSNNQKEEYHPKRILAENTEYIDLLFKLLSEDIQAVNDVWDLLMRLPLNEKLQESLYKITDTWENLLDIKSPHLHRLLYCLQIIEGFLLDREKERAYPIDLTEDDVKAPFRDREWADKFYKTGGLQPLITILLKPELETIKSPIAIKTLSLILKIVCYYFSGLSFSEIYPKDQAPAIEAIVVKRTIDLLHSICEYSLQREQKETDADRANQPIVKIPGKDAQNPLKLPENLYYEGEMLYYAQSLFLVTIKRNTALLKEIYEYPKLEKLLAEGLIQSDNTFLKEKLSYGLIGLMNHFQNASISVQPHQFFLPILLQKTLEIALVHEERSNTFFRTITNILNQVDIGKVNLNVDALLDRLVRFVKERKPTERNQKDTDVVLFGILQVLRSLFLRYPEKTAKYGQDEKLVSELLSHCLFQIPRRTDKKTIPGPKCKSHETRNAAFKLLLELAKGDNKNLQEIVDYLLPIHKNGKWRSKRYTDWNIIPKENEKSSTGYVGLKNLACICYMNSTLQQLYMIPSFRKVILAVPDKEYNTTPKEDNLLYQLKCIFLALNESEKQYYNPKGFCHAFKDYEGNPTNVYEQMDAEEFLNVFMDRLETRMKGTKYEKAIKQHFGGVLTNELICKGCPHYSEREEPFLNISLQVKNKKNIYQSLAAFIEGEMLEGDNAYFCATCNKKVNTLKRTCLKRLPNHLILTLKRFEFDFDTMAKIKVNDYCEFPHKLNLEPYTQQGLRKAERAKKGDQGDQQDQTNTKEYPPSYFEYKLTGIVIHIGVADAGHYYSLIMDRELTDLPEEKRWYEFNDTIVSRFDPKDIPSEAFGGEEKWRYYGSDNMMGSYKEKIKNAYLLIYERITPFPDEEETAPTEPPKKEESKEDKDEGPSQANKKGENAITEPQTTQPEKPESIEDDIAKNIPHEFLQQILEKNQTFHVMKNVFSKEYFEFQAELFLEREYSPNLNYDETHEINVKTHPKQFYDLLMIKLATTFFLTSIIREKYRNQITDILPALKKQYAQNVPASLWLLELFSAKKIIAEFLLDSVIGDMRNFVVGLLSVAIRVVYQYEGKGANNRLFETDPKTKLPTTTLANFINACINIMFEAKQNARNYTEFFKLFCEIINCGPETAGYLINKRVIGRIMDFFFDQSSPYNQFFRDMSDVPYKEPKEIEIGVPQDEKVKVRTPWEELLLRRKERNQMESHLASKAYMWKAVNTLVRYCRFNPNVERCQWQIGDDDYEVHNNERVLLTPDSKFIERAITESDGKIGYRNIAQMYSYLSYEDERFTKIFITAIKNTLSEAGCHAYRPFLRCFSTVLTLKDSLSNYRCSELCDFLIELLKESKGYFLEMQELISFLIKIIGRVEPASKYLLARINKWSWISDWLSQHPTPPLGMSQSIKITKRRIVDMSMLKYDLHEYKARSNIKLRQLKEIESGSIQDKSKDWDSDDDLGDHDFKVGEEVDLDPRGNGKWVLGEVKHLLEEMIQVGYIDHDKSHERIWIAKDSDQLAPGNTMTKIQEEVEEEARKFAHINVKKEKSGDDTDHEGYAHMEGSSNNNSDFSDDLYDQ